MTDQATFSVALAGRDIAFRYPIAGQLIMLRRRTLRLQEKAHQAPEDEQISIGSQMIVDTLDLVESLIVNPQDVEFLETAMLHGQVSHEQIMDVLRLKQEPDKPVAKKRASKAPVKKTANRGRAQR